MAKVPEAVKIKIQRNRILSVLDTMYPTPLQLGTLYESGCCYIDPAYSFELFTKDISYLKDKGYVEFIDEKIGGAGEFKKKVVGLTARGKEIAEQTQTDPALEI